MLTKICYTHTNKNDPSFAHSSQMDTQFETITVPSLIYFTVAVAFPFTRNKSKESVIISVSDPEPDLDSGVFWIRIRNPDPGA